MRALAALGSWMAVNVLLWGLLLALVIRRRLRHLLSCCWSGSWRA
jgi:hypothetical protein